jgi:hypothetical protein
MLDAASIDASTAALPPRLNLHPPSSVPQRAVAVPLLLQPQRHLVQHGVIQARQPQQAGFAPGFAQAMVQQLPPGAGDHWVGVSRLSRGEPCGYPGHPGLEEELTSQGGFKRAWTAEEDANLLQLVKGHGAQSWSVIADKLQGRVGKQCRERYTTPCTTPIAPNRRVSPGPCYQCVPTKHRSTPRRPLRAGGTTTCAPRSTKRSLRRRRTS